MLGLVDRNIVQKVVKEHGTDKHQNGINTRTHLVAMFFMQIADAGSLRDTNCIFRLI